MAVELEVANPEATAIECFQVRTLCTYTARVGDIVATSDGDDFREASLFASSFFEWVCVVVTERKEDVRVLTVF